MTNRREAIRKLEFMRDAYQKLIDENVDEGRLVDADVTETWKADTPLNEVYAEHVEALDLAISALEKQEQDRWVPVTERLPEIKHHIDDEHFSDEVLVTERFNGFKKTRIGIFDTRAGWWNDEKGCGFLGVITSWRPLPEPYTEEES